MSKRSGSPHIKPWANGHNGEPIVLDKDVDPVRRASSSVMASRKVLNARGARASKSPQPAAFPQIVQQNNPFAAQQVNGTSDSNLSNGFAAQGSDSNSFGASQSFPPTNFNNNNNNIFGAQQQQNASFPPPQQASPGIFSSMTGSKGSFDFNANSANSLSNPFKNMSANQAQENYGQWKIQKKRINADSMEGRDQPDDYDGENTPQFTNPEGVTFSGPLNGAYAPPPDLSSQFNFGQTTTASPTPEPQQNSNFQQQSQQAAHPQSGASQNVQDSSFGQNNTQPQQTNQASFNLFAQSYMQPQQSSSAPSNTFGQMASQQPQSSQAPTPSMPSPFQPTNTFQTSQAPFNLFAQTSAQTSQTSQAPSNIFGHMGSQTPQTSQAPSNMFGQMESQKPQTSQAPSFSMPSPFQATNTSTYAPSNNPFQFGNTSQIERSQGESSGFSPFRPSTQAPAGGSSEAPSNGFKPSIFSTSSSQGNKSLFQFGTPQANDSSKSSSSLFQTSATPKQQLTGNNTASNIFKPSTSDSERPSSPPKSPPKQSHNLFQSSTTSTPQATDSSGVSSVLKAPTTDPDRTSSPPKSPPKSPSKNPFASIPRDVEEVNKSGAPNTSNFSAPPKPFASSISTQSFGTSQQAQTPSKQPTATAQPSNLFATSTNAQSSNLFKSSLAPSQPSTPGKSSNIFQSSPSKQPSNSPSKLFQASPAPSPATMSSTTAETSTRSDEPRKTAFTRYLSLVSFNRSFIFALQQMDPNADLSPMFDAYRSELVKIQHSLPAASKRKAEDDLPATTPKRSKPIEEPSTTPTHSPSKSQASNIIDDVLSQPSTSNTPSKPAASTPNFSSGFTPKPSTGFTPSANAFSGSTLGATAVQSNNIFGGFTPKPPTGQTSNVNVFTPQATPATGSTSGILGGFVPKPSTPSAAANGGSTGFMPKVTSSSGTGSDFFAAFSKKAEKTAEDTKKRRKAEEFDSDEDDEAEWERKYEEEQRAKKQKTEEDAKKNKVEYQAGAGFLFKPTAGQNEISKEQPGGTSSNQVNSVETPSKLSTPAATNPFQHLSDSAATDQSGDEGDDESDGRAAEDEAIESADAHSNVGSNEKSSSTPGRSLLERSTRDDGKPAFNRDGTPTSTPPPGTRTPTNGASFMGQSTSIGSNLFGVKPTTREDHTWKPDSPLKFASYNYPNSIHDASDSGEQEGANVPKFNFTAPTPEKPNNSPFKSIFETPSNHGSDGASDSGTRPFKGLFGSNNADPSPSLFQSKTPTGSAGTPTKFNTSGFTFGGPPKSDGLVAPSSLSRATTPGTDVTSANESAVDTDNDEAAPPEEQTDLTSLTAQEKQDNDVLYEEEKAKLSHFVKDPKPAWESKGTGPFRLLKSKETGVTRILMRASPSGRIVMNSRLQPSVQYKHKGKSMVQFSTVDESGKPQTWVLRTAKDENAAALAAAMEANKE